MSNCARISAYLWSECKWNENGSYVKKIVPQNSSTVWKNCKQLEKWNWQSCSSGVILDLEIVTPYVQWNKHFYLASLVNKISVNNLRQLLQILAHWLVNCSEIPSLLLPCNWPGCLHSPNQLCFYMLLQWAY